MKKLKVPYLETLDVLDLSSVGFLMEKAQRESIDVVNWEEYPYKPIVAFDIARSKVNLYIRYFVKGNSLKALYEADGSPVLITTISSLTVSVLAMLLTGNRVIRKSR